MRDHDPLPSWHVGPWTARGSAAGQPLAPGRLRSPDELNFDIVGLARILGRRVSGTDELAIRLWQNELRPTHTRRCGEHVLADAADAARLAGAADDAFAWLAARAPDGYEFVRTDALELRPVAGGPSVEAALAEQPLDPALARLAAASVRRGSDGGWYASDGICRWSGPHPNADAAVAVIAAARAELAVRLPPGAAERWPAVRVDGAQLRDQLATK